MTSVQLSVQMKEIGGPKMCKMHQHAEKTLEI